jgi:hypothetical protein
VLIPAVCYGWTPWGICFKIPTLDRDKGRAAERLGRPWKCELSENGVWVHARGARQDDVDQGKEND